MDDDLQSKYLRALADYQNLEKQTQAWKEDFLKYANEDLALELLEVLDDLEKAQEHLKDDGLQIVLEKLIKILKNNGVEEIEVLNKEYDAETAEVVATEDGEKNNLVAKVLQKGYKLNGKIIRPAKVIVNKADNYRKPAEE